jgi:hypothetical protein
LCQRTACAGSLKSCSNFYAKATVVLRVGAVVEKFSPFEGINRGNIFAGRHRARKWSGTGARNERRAERVIRPGLPSGW